MDYEKKYNEALERAKEMCSMPTDKATMEYIFPELRESESEDERIRKWLVDYFGSIKNTAWIHRDITCEQILAYLEKQKENPKNAISIPADCATDAKCEDRWHKTANSLPDDGRDVLAKDALGNFLLASFDGAQWFVSVYDGEDHPVLHTPPILEWSEIPSEKQKEQKPAEWREEKQEEHWKPSDQDELMKLKYAGTSTKFDAAFIAGAEWQAEQLLKSSPLPEDTVLFNKGVEEGKRLAEKEQADLFTIVALDAAQRAKEQMMKEAVEGEICHLGVDFLDYNISELDEYIKRFKVGDKVRIIIVKE